MLKGRKFKIIVFLIFLYPFTSLSQSIVNTENMSTKTDSTFVLITSLDGNYTTGNVELIQLNTANQISYKSNRNLMRLFFNYEFISSNKSTVSSDYTTQFRYSYNLKNNSIYSFIQGQKAVSLSLNSRYLVGIGYRQNLIRKGNNYVDMASGPFFENEKYLKNTVKEVEVTNIRISFSSFLNFKIAKNLYKNTVFYYQLNTSNFKDYRIYFEPKISYNLEHFKIYSTLSYRFHSTPYININKTNSQLLFGVNYELGID